MFGGGSTNNSADSTKRGDFAGGRAFNMTQPLYGFRGRIKQGPDVTVSCFGFTLSQVTEHGIFDHTIRSLERCR